MIIESIGPTKQKRIIMSKESMEDGFGGMGVPVAVSVSWLSRQPSTRVGSSRACFCACACDYDCESPVVSPYVGSEGLPRTPVFSASKTRWPCIDFDLTCRVSSRHPLHPSPTGAATSAGFPYLSTCWRSVISYRTLWPWSHGPHVPGLSPWPFQTLVSVGYAPSP